MFSKIEAVRYNRYSKHGRNQPCLLTCIDDNGEEVEVYTKLRGSKEITTHSFIAESISAMLAADLDLPIPEPFCVQISFDFASVIPDIPKREIALKSIGYNFGSKKLPCDYSPYLIEKAIPENQIQTAAEILAFDTFIENNDRKQDNPNLLTNGKTLAIYDHDLALRMGVGIIGWKPAWDSNRFPKVDEMHVLLQQLRGKPLDFNRFIKAFKSIDDTRLKEYGSALPTEWIENAIFFNDILDYLKDLRDNIDIAIDILKGELK